MAITPVGLALTPALDAENKIQPRTIAASWEAVEGATSYNLRWRRAEADFQDEDQVSIAATETTAAFTVSEDGKYQVELRGIVGDGLVALASTKMQVKAYKPGHLSLFPMQDCRSRAIAGIQADPVDGGVEARWDNPTAAITSYQYQVQHGTVSPWGVTTGRTPQAPAAAQLRTR